MAVDLALPRERLADRALPIIGIAIALGFVGIIVAFTLPNGRILMPILIFAAMMSVPLVLARPVWGLYGLAVAAVVIEENYLAFGTRITDQIPLFQPLSAVTGMPGLVPNAVECVFVLVVLGWLLKAGYGGTLRLRPVPVVWPLALFAALVLFGVMRGLSFGADIKTILWMVRALLYLVVGYVLTSQLLENRGQVHVILWIFIAGVLLKGLVGWLRYWVDLDGSLANMEGITGQNSLMAHEESVFYLAAIVLASVYGVFGGPKRQRLVTLAALPIVLLPFMANQRRAASLALIIALVAVLVLATLLLPSKRGGVIAMIVVIAAIVPIYGSVFWNTSGLLGEPVRAVKSGFSPDKRDLASNDYRDAENYNMRETTKWSGLVGVGFGVEMQERHQMADLSSTFEWYKMAPHNTILWLAMTTGITGFILFWHWVGSTIVAACHAARRLRDPVDKGVVVFAMVMLICFLVFAFLDQGLLSMRSTLFLGIILAAALALPRLEPQSKGAEA